MFMANGKRHHIIKREITKKSFKRVYDIKKLVAVAEALLSLWQHAVLLVVVRSKVH